MLWMILRMTGVMVLYVLLTALLWKYFERRQLRPVHKIIIGLIYGGCSVLSTHFAVDYSDMLLNLRDLGPLAAGLYFDPFSGLIAGLIGGIERYIAGTYWGIGSYTRIACSVSTCLAGFLAAALRVWLFRNKKPSTTFALLFGAVMEVFHMYVVLITHRNDMAMALYVVRICSGPMIFFTGLGLAVCSTVLRILSGEWQNPFRRLSRDEVPVSRKFQFWLFVFTIGILLANLLFSYGTQTATCEQSARDTMLNAVSEVREIYTAHPDLFDEEEAEEGEEPEDKNHLMVTLGWDGSVDVIRNREKIVAGTHAGLVLMRSAKSPVLNAEIGTFFNARLFGIDSLCRIDTVDESGNLTVLVRLPTEELYRQRNDQMLETAFADIVLFAVVYTLISLLVQQIVVRNLGLVNASLTKITGGDLNEIVNVRGSSEFSSLSDDINMTVETLKGYIDAAEKRIEQELVLARTIQDSALPKNFTFQRGDFEIYALMQPAREVGGDFYDFFFVAKDRFAMVIADVSGKGIPAALFMMRAKTAIRGLAESGNTPAEILARANKSLSDGNEADMFVTVWVGIVNLATGLLTCANAGHEYPALMRAGGDFELLKDRHGLALGAMDSMTYQEYEVQLNYGDRLFVYTDGIPEAINRENQPYGTGRLISALNRVKDDPLSEALPAIQKDLATFVDGADPFDDVTMLGFTCLGNKPEA